MWRKTTALASLTMLNTSVIGRKVHSGRKWRWNTNAAAVTAIQSKMRPDALLFAQCVTDALFENRANHAAMRMWRRIMMITRAHWMFAGFAVAIILQFMAKRHIHNEQFSIPF